MSGNHTEEELQAIREEIGGEVLDTIMTRAQAEKLNAGQLMTIAEDVAFAIFLALNQTTPSAWDEWAAMFYERFPHKTAEVRERVAAAGSVIRNTPKMH